MANDDKDKWGSSAGSDSGDANSQDDGAGLSDAHGGEDGLDVASSGGAYRTPVPAEKRARRRGASPAPSSFSGTPGALALAVRPPHRLQRPTPPKDEHPLAPRSSRRRGAGAETNDVVMTCMMCLGSSKVPSGGNSGQGGAPPPPSGGRILNEG